MHYFSFETQQKENRGKQNGQVQKTFAL